MPDGKTVDEHFWFTASAVGINSFVMSLNRNLGHWAVAPAAATVISAYAAFLILHRSAAHAGKLRDPAGLPPRHEDRTWKHKLAETGSNMKVVVPHALWVACELSGAFFYLLLVVLSCVGAWLARSGFVPK